MVLLGLMTLDHASKRMREAGIKKDTIEGYENEPSKSTEVLGAGAGMDRGLLFVMYLVSMSFLLLEIILIFYALTVAFKCSKPGINRVVHVTLALFFTAPYVLFSLFMGDCAGKI